MTVRFVARALMQLLVGSAVACASAGSKTRAPETCRAGYWLPPRPLRTAQGYTVFMELPAVLPLHGKAFILSSIATTYDSSGRVVWPLVPPPETSVQKPEQIAVGVIADSNALAELVAEPKDLAVGPVGSIATVDDKGVAHVVWASNDSEPSTSITTMRSLWYARFENDRWNSPARILTSSGTLMWTQASRSSLVAHGGSLHLALAIMGGGVHYLRFSDGVWSNHIVGALGVSSGYPHVAVLDDGRVVIIAQGGIPHSLTHSMSVVYASFSDDAGRTWAPLTQVSDSVSQPTYDFHLLVDGSVLYALWYQQTDARGEPALKPTLMEGPGRVHIARSVNRGRTWQRFAPSSLLSAARGLRALLQPDHAILVALVDAGSERVYTAIWSNGWRPFDAHQAAPTPFNPTLGLDAAHRPVLTWGIRHSHDWLGTMMSTYVPCQ